MTTERGRRVLDYLHIHPDAKFIVACPDCPYVRDEETEVYAEKLFALHKVVCRRA